MGKKKGIELTDEAKNRLSAELDREKAAGRNNNEIAFAVGVAPETLSAWKSGRKRPGRDKIEKLARVLHVRSAYILGRNPYRNIEDENADDDAWLNQLEHESSPLAIMLSRGAGYRARFTGDEYLFTTSEGQEIRVPVDRYEKAEKLAQELAVSAFRSLCL